MSDKPKKDLTDLRESLFDTIEKLKNKEIDIETARGVSELGKVMIDSAKVEVEFIRQIGGEGSGFIPRPDPERDIPGQIIEDSKKQKQIGNNKK